MATTDPRLTAYAELLVDRCIGVRAGWQVLLVTTAEARPLVDELGRLVAERGAYVLPRISFGAWYPVDAAWIAAAEPELARRLAPLEQHVVDHVDGTIVVIAPSDPPLDEGASAAAKTAFRSQLMAYRARGRSGEMREVRCDFPTTYFAREAGLSLEEYEDVFYEACLRDWDAEGRRMEPIRERFDRADEVRIIGPETDLRLSLEGRRGDVDDGHVNVPGGEVYYCPVEDSVEGEIVFEFPSRSVERPRLVLRGGEVVEASAAAGEDVLHEALDTDGGSRRFGELGIGCNDGITRHLRNVLFDEKMAGTVHLALGQGFPRIGGRNESALHWDLVKDLRNGGELWADGELVQQDGRWVL